MSSSRSIPDWATSLRSSSLRIPDRKTKTGWPYDEKLRLFLLVMGVAFFWGFLVGALETLVLRNIEESPEKGESPRTTMRNTPTGLS